jgi:hypothetical protein
MVLSMSYMYLWVGVGMLDSAWLSGFRVEQLWITHWGSSDSLATLSGLKRVFALALAWSLLATVFGLAVGLLLPRQRLRFVVLGVALHLALWPFVGAWPFTLAVLSCYSAIVPADAWHNFFDVVFDRPEQPATE